MELFLIATEKCFLDVVEVLDSHLLELHFFTKFKMAKINMNHSEIFALNMQLVILFIIFSITFYFIEHLGL